MKKHGRAVPVPEALFVALKIVVVVVVVAVASTGCGGSPGAPAPGAPAAPPGVPVQATDAKVAAGHHRVVFELTGEDHDLWEKVLNNVENLRRALGADKTDVAIVVHGGALSMLLATNRDQSTRMEELSRAGVTFLACENTMKKKNVTKDDLLPFAKTVDSGVAEVVRREEAGWAYVRSTK